MDDLANSQFQKALGLAQDHKYQESIKLCRLILLGQPKYVECRLLLAKSLLALARYEEVLAETQILMDLDPENAEGYSLKGEAHFFKGDFVAAHAALQKAVRLDPGDRKVQRLLADIEPSMGTGGGGPDKGDDPAATRSYPLAEQATDVDPTEMMESPPVIEPWDEEDEDADAVAPVEDVRVLGMEAGERSMDGARQSALDAETVAGHSVDPRLLAASRRPDVEPGSEDADTARESVLSRRESSVSSASSMPRGISLEGDEEEAGEEEDGKDSDRQSQAKRAVEGPSSVSESETVPVIGSKMKARRAVVEGVEAATPVEEGPRGAVVKFLPSDQLVTVEQVAITTGEIKAEGLDGSFDLGDSAPRESPTSEAGTVSLKVTPPPKVGRKGRTPRPSVEIGDAAFLPRPRRVRPLARHGGRLPAPAGAQASLDADDLDVDGLEDEPTTPHLDISNVGPAPMSKAALPPVGRRGGRLARSRPAGLDLGLKPQAPDRPAAPPARQPTPPLPGSAPASSGAQPGPDRVASSPSPVDRESVARPPRADAPVGGVVPSGSGPPRPPIPPAVSAPPPGTPGRGAVVVPGSSVRARPQGSRRHPSRSGGSGPAVGAGSQVGRVPSAPGSGTRRNARPMSQVRPGGTQPESSRSVVTGRGRGASPVGRRKRGPGTSVTSVPSRRPKQWWRRRSVRIGGAVGGVVLLAALAGWFYVRWVRSSQAAKKRERALMLMARADPEALFAARFLFARVEKLGVHPGEAAAGRALVNLLATLEYGDSAGVAEQILRRKETSSNALAMAARAGLFLVRGDVERALEASRRATAKYPKSSWAFYFRAAAQDALGDFDGAVGGGRRSLSLKPGTGIAGALLLARIWRDQGLSFSRPTAVDKALEIVNRLAAQDNNKAHPALLLAEAQTRLAKCSIRRACPCADLNPLVDQLEKLQLGMQNNMLGSVFLPRIRLVRAALLTCLRRSSSAGLVLPDLSTGSAGRPDLDAMYASLLIELRRPGQASAFLERALHRYPGWNLFHLMLARAALARKDFVRAGKVLDDVPKTARSAAWYGLSVHLLLAEGKTDKALTLARKAVREYSDRVDLGLALVDALLAAGKTDQAGKRAEDLFSHHPNDTKVLTTSAAILAQRGEFLRAKARLDSALGRDPNNATIRLHLGRVLMGLGKYDEAKRHIKRAVANQPDLAAGWLALGRIEEIQGRFASAVAQYRKLMVKHPKSLDAAYALAGALVHLGRLDEAEKQLAKIPEQQHRGRWHLLYGWLLLRKGEDLPKAVEELKRAARSGLRGRELTLAMVRRAEAFLLLDQPSQAEDVLASLDGRQRSLPEVKSLWGRIWLWRAKPKRAVGWFRRALAACSRCPLWQKARLYAFLARAYYLKGSTRLAWAKFRRAFRLAGTDPVVSLLHGACLYEEDREDLALRRLKSAISRDPALVEAYFYLGEIAMSSGNRQEAAAFLRKFVHARRFGALADDARNSLQKVAR